MGEVHRRKILPDPQPRQFILPPTVISDGIGYLSFELPVGMLPSYRVTEGAVFLYIGDVPGEDLFLKGDLRYT